MTLTFTYVSTIDAALRKDKMNAHKRNFMHYIPMIATELQRLIFSFIDLDTRIYMLFDAKPFLIRNSHRPTDVTDLITLFFSFLFILFPPTLS